MTLGGGGRGLDFGEINCHVFFSHVTWHGFLDIFRNIYSTRTHTHREKDIGKCVC